MKERSFVAGRCASSLTLACAALAALALHAAPAAAQPLLMEAPPPATQRESGFVLAPELGATFSLFSVVGSSRSALPLGEASGGLALGVKSGRFIGTLGLGMSNTTSSGSGSSTRATVFQVTPGIQVALARSADRKVELPFTFQVGLGSAVASGGGDLPLVVGYRIASGARYWAHPQLALQLLAGFSGTWLIQLGQGGGSTGVNGISGSLGAVAVF